MAKGSIDLDLAGPDEHSAIIVGTKTAHGGAVGFCPDVAADGTYSF